MRHERGTSPPRQGWVHWFEAVAVVSLLGWKASAVLLRRAAKKTRWLEDTPPAPDEACPPLSVVVPACNEAETIEPAMCSLLQADYPDLEVIAVDDRSTDKTGGILDRLASADSRLRVHHLNSLPGGWLGKNHALWEGARESRGEWVLFTDADVLYAPDALRRALALATQTGADHLSLAPRILLQGFWEHLLVSYFVVMFNVRFRPWDVENPRSPAYNGIGAFNLVRREAYFEIGGHARMPLEVADDVKLGKLFKRAGRQERFAIAGELVQVRWIVGFRGFVAGLTKNMFAGVGFRWRAVFGLTAFLGLTHVLPLPGLFVGSRISRLAFAGTVLAMVACAAPPARARRQGGYPSPLLGLAYPIASLIWLYTLWHSAAITQRQGGVNWRGTLYPLHELRGGIV